MSDTRYQTALALFSQGRDSEGAQALGAAAMEGHPSSMSLLGRQRLSGRGAAFDMAGGARLILAAAERGDGAACVLAATLYARGYGGRPDWTRALDYLQRAAEMDFQPARDQLRLLSGDEFGTDWPALRGAVDMDAWRQPPPPVPLSESPLIVTAPGLLSADLCDALIARAGPLLGAAPVYNELKGGNALVDGRRHSAAMFSLTDMDLVTEAVTARLCALAGVPAAHAESLQVLHYQVGEYFAPHYDFWNPGFAAHAATLHTHGQRIYTVLVYLNDDLDGGETEFLWLRLRHRGRKGDALMFRNVDAAGRPDDKTLHAGRPPIRGEKWLLSLWIRDRPAPEGGDPDLMAAMSAPPI